MQKLKTLSGVASVAEDTGPEGESRYIVTAADGGDIRSQVAELVVGSGAGLLEFKRESLSLEEVFLKLTTVESH